jgi:hypothetical protein
VGDAPELSILLLTEDGAKAAQETMEAIVRGMLRLIDGEHRADRVGVVRPNQLARDVMKGNQWRARNPKDIGLRQRIVVFGRFVAAKLLERESFVLLHFDGDHAWADRRLAEDEKVADFVDFVSRRVVPALDHALHEQRRDGRDVDVDAGRRAALLRFRRITPFYSIEAWLFQNTAEARRLCMATCGKHLDEIQRWETDRGALDEIDKAKDQLPCVETQQHVALAGSAFPAREVFAAGKSYAAAVDNLRRCRDLRSALIRTHR